jgi:hypothetical protein
MILGGGIEIRTVRRGEHYLHCPTHNAPQHVTDVTENNSLHRLRRYEPTDRRIIAAQQFRDRTNRRQEWNM